MRKKIYVLSQARDWKVQCEHCTSQVTNTQAEAIRIAKQHVASLPAGSLSQIIIQGTDGKFLTEWTYGSDPFPPRG